VASGQGLAPGRAAAARRLRAAVAAAPFMVGGSGRVDTELMAQFGERVCCKVGAEGVYCAALPEAGWGIALKMDDGNTARACEVVLCALLEALGLARNAAEHALLARLSNVTLRNRRGAAVGRLAPGAGWRRDLPQAGA
jgi:L-asparaginase II